ncbi:hypothetical protein CU665_08665 [Pseudomonas syringae pv. actinidifoliorum]|nr:hypothetical protein [Pseudomonas syringae pv. actinidifoliorum]NAT38854.1 hypothetical protein [Pseudomonas syringae pv. actinidifoliorum]
MSSQYGGNATRQRIIKKLIGLLAIIAENDSWLECADFGPRRKNCIVSVQILKNLVINPLDKLEV